MKISIKSFQILVHFVLTFLSATAAVAAECGYFQSLEDLTVDMDMIATGKFQAGRASAEHVARDIERVDLDQVRQLLRRMDQSKNFHHFEQLVDYAEKYAREYRVSDPASLTRTVYHAERLLKEVCATHFASLPGEEDAGRGPIDKVISTLLPEGAAQRTGFLYAFVAVIIGFLFALKYATQYLIGFLHDKKTCRVQAQIMGGEQVFSGIVTRAGLNGVRFEFKAADEAKRLTDLMATPDFVSFDLRVGDNIWPVFVDGFHKFFSPLYFLERLSRNDLYKILSRSTDPIRTAPSIGHRSTRWKWRAELKRRKATIRNVALRRANSAQAKKAM